MIRTCVSTSRHEGADPKVRYLHVAPVVQQYVACLHITEVAEEGREDGRKGTTKTCTNIAGITRVLSV
jgi:hypothetical protein